MPHKRIVTRPEGLLWDPVDDDLVESTTWFLSSWGYACGYLKYNGKNKMVWLHKLIGFAPDGFEVDHINGNRLDNRRANLRYVTRSVNGQNRTRLASNSTTGFTGIHFDKSRKKWMAHATAGAKKLHKRFDTREQAIEARLAWCRENMPGFIEGHPYRG